MSHRLTVFAGLLTVAICGCSQGSSPAVTNLQMSLAQGPAASHVGVQAVQNAKGTLLLYAPQQGLGSVDVYDALTGKHLQSIAGPQTNACAPYGAAADSSGNIWVAEACGSVINEYAKGASGNVAPINAITSSAANNISNPLDVAIDGSDKIYVTNSGSQSVDIFAASASGPAAPISVIAGPKCEFNSPSGVAVDSMGNVYVSNSLGQSIAVFDVSSIKPGMNNIKPDRLIQGSKTTFVAPYGVALDDSSNIYVGNYGGADALKFLAGSGGGKDNAQPVAVYDGPLLIGVAVSQGSLYSSGVESDSSGNYGIIDVFDIAAPNKKPRQFKTGTPGDSSGANLISLRAFK